jgi:Holliday junction DNA helicase RuvA
MITKISGKITHIAGDSLSLAIGPIEHEVLIPEFTRRQLQHKLGEETSLYTIEYLEGDPARGRMTPRLVGFTSSVEREFFELFCQVDGVGVKKALRAMVRPVQEVATLIEEQDTKGLAGLPGIGPSTAERVVAKLRRKVPKFALLVGRDTPTTAGIEHDLVSEVYEILCTLGHSEAEARRLLDGVTAGKKKYKDVESLLHAVYESRQ